MVLLGVELKALCQHNLHGTLKNKFRHLVMLKKSCSTHLLASILEE